MIAYFRCVCKSADKLLARKLQGEGVEIRLTKNNPENREASKLYGCKMPFIVQDGVATEI